MVRDKKAMPEGGEGGKPLSPDREMLADPADMQEVPSTARDQGLIDRKQRQIVDGACQVMFKKGFHGTSIRDVAAACNMSMGQLYHYIASKDDILYLVHRRMQEVWFGHLSDAGMDRISDPRQRLENTLRLTLNFIHHNKELILFIYTETKYLEREHLRQVLEIDDKNIVGFYRNLLAQLPAAGLDERTADTAANLVAFIMVFLSLRGWNLREDELQENIDYITGFVMRGLGLAG